jgi:hypothetical protein
MAMITDTPELRRLLFIAQQRRARFCAIKVLIPTEDNEEKWNDNDQLLHDARIALMQATAELMDYLQAQVDSNQ